MSLSLQLLLDRGTHYVGDVVSGTVRVVEGGRSRTLEVALEYVEATEDYRRVARTVPGEPLHSEELVAGATFPFALTLPADGLPDYRSQHGSLTWQVHVRSDELGPDTHVQEALSVLAKRP